MDDDVRGVDPYADPTTGVLVNKLGIGDAATLAEAEDDIVTAGLEVLRMQPIHGRFYFAHLRAIHRYLFGPLYAWAGEACHVDGGAADLLASAS